MLRISILILVTSLISSYSSTIIAETNWFQFRGPEGTGVAEDANPPTTWSKERNVKWKVAIPGQGSASPIIWNDYIYLVTAIKTDRTLAEQARTQDNHKQETIRFAAKQTDQTTFQLVQNTSPAEETDPSRERGEGRRRRRGWGFGFGRGNPPTNVHEFVVICLDRQSGKTVWQKTACEAIPHEGHHGTASFASASPITDGKNLYVSFGSRGIYSYDMAGNLRWSKDLGQFRMRNSFGEGTSPVLSGETLIINCDQEDQSFIVALNTNSGEVLWREERDEATSWTSPFIVEHGGITQVVVNGTNRVRSYNLENGELIWECGGQVFNPVATPVIYNDLVIVMTGRRGYSVQAISLDSHGDVTDTEKVAWSHNEGTPYVPSPLLYGDRLYYTKSNNAILTCVNAGTGEVFYKNERIQGLDMIYSSPVGAAGMVYISGRNGTTVVLKDGTEFEIIATNEIGETIDATPAIIGNEMFIRGENHLFCIAEN